MIPMRPPSTTSPPVTAKSFLPRRVIIAITAAGVILAALVGVGLYGFIRSPAHPAADAGTARKPAASPSPTTGLQPEALIHTGDPVTYAKAIARALFVWNTMSALSPQDYQSVVSEDADPSGMETSALVNDLAAYYPTDAQWQQLQRYKTAESLTFQRAYIPAAWGKSLASDPSTVRPGTTAVTIDAVRHRTGSWYRTPASTSDPVSFTVFVACQPTFPRCHILRLSGPNTPLK
jgi:hypothetical protein